MKNRILLFVVMMISGCVHLPKPTTAIDGFDVNRYLGTWYEIARLDHSFERGLSHVTATYTLRKDGGIHVVNRGYDTSTKKWKQAEGRAYFVETPDLGRLKVSFFGPFYGAYNIIALDKIHYQYSMVCGPNHSYLWILARQPVMDPTVRESLIDYARSLEFETDKLIFVDHSTDDRKEENRIID